jgi:hypothetical protein
MLSYTVKYASSNREDHDLAMLARRHRASRGRVSWRNRPIDVHIADTDGSASTHADSGARHACDLNSEVELTICRAVSDIQDSAFGYTTRSFRQSRVLSAPLWLTVGDEMSATPRRRCGRGPGVEPVLLRT